MDVSDSDQSSNELDTESSSDDWSISDDEEEPDETDLRAVENLTPFFLSNRSRAFYVLSAPAFDDTFFARFANEWLYVAIFHDKTRGIHRYNSDKIWIYFKRSSPEEFVIVGVSFVDPKFQSPKMRRGVYRFFNDLLLYQVSIPFMSDYSDVRRIVFAPGVETITFPFDMSPNAQPYFRFRNVHNNPDTKTITRTQRRVFYAPRPPSLEPMRYQRVQRDRQLLRVQTPVSMEPQPQYILDAAARLPSPTPQRSSRAPSEYFTPFPEDRESSVYYTPAPEQPHLPPDRSPSPEPVPPAQRRRAGYYHDVTAGKFLKI